MVPTSPEDLLEGDAAATALFGAVQHAIDEIGGAERRVSRSQIGWYRGHPFAAVWIPGRALRRPAAPLVLTVFAPVRIASGRFEEVVEPVPGRFSHHLELQDVGDVDDEVRDWLRAARDAAN